MHKARKRFGQHFLHDQHIIESLVRSINPQAGEKLLEIGPGQGALTFPLLRQCKSLTAVELDRDLIPFLQRESAALGQLEIINADILEFELSSLDDEGPYRLVGNLPYNISTPLMFHLLKSVDQIQDMHFMVQKEVALRIVSSPGDANYGRLSVMLQYLCQSEYLFDVGPESFTPPPRVDSAVIRLIPHPSPIHDIGDHAMFSKIVQSAFSQRRKTISNSMKGVVDRDLLISCDIDPKLRAENLSVEDFAKLSKACTK
jgi:16S rRNA (adenine1518-N6/adenine1519-N6)-dimethyltransferase